MNEKRISGRARDLAPFRVMATLARAHALEAEGRSVIHMEAGEPDFTAPQAITEAAIAAVRAGRTRYTQSAGLPALRSAIARYYAERHAVDLDPRRIIVTPGATGALELSLLCSADVGDRVLISDPGYPCHRQVSRLMGLEPVLIPGDPEDRFRVAAQRLQPAGPARVILFASPANPTGAVADAADVQAAGTLAREWSGRLVVDELYLDLAYGEPLKSTLTMMHDAFVIGGFSKYHGMTGWRLGWVVVPEDCSSAAERLAENLFLAPSTVAQHGALAAFDRGCVTELQQRVVVLRERRDWMVAALRDLGMRIPVVPEGAFYIYADCSALTADSTEFCTRLLEEAGVAVAPGCDFGVEGAQRHVRFALTLPLAELREGIRRMQAWLMRR